MKRTAIDNPACASMLRRHSTQESAWHSSWDRLKAPRNFLAKLEKLHLQSVSISGKTFALLSSSSFQISEGDSEGHLS